MRSLDEELRDPRYRDDPLLHAMSGADRRRVGEIWQHRASSELGAGSAFSQVLVGLEAIGARPEVIALARQAALEETAHARGCHRLAEIYLDDDLVMPTPRLAALPAHRGATDALRVTLHVIGLSCINETIACEFVSRCLDESDALAVREVSQRHLRDEIGHARVGWAHLASGVIDAQDRAQLASWLPRLVKANGEHWLARMRTLPEDGVRGHGYPAIRQLEAAVHHALRAVVVPGLAHVGIDVTRTAAAVAALG